MWKITDSHNPHPFRQCLKWLSIQCGQNNFNNRCALHRVLPLGSSLLGPRACGRDTCQEDNTMTESEVQGVRGQSGPGRGGEKVNGVLPAERSLLYRVLQDEQWTKQAETAAPAERFGCVSSVSFTQGLRDECKKQRCQQNGRNSTLIQTPLSGRRELISASKLLAPSLRAAATEVASPTLHFYYST